MQCMLHLRDAYLSPQSMSQQTMQHCSGVLGFILPPTMLNTLSEHTFFKNYGQLQYYRTIRPGSDSSSPLVTDIIVLCYKPDGIQYKLSFDDDWLPLPVRCPSRKASVESDPAETPPLYASCLSIRTEKFIHLQQLKNALSNV